MDDPAPESKDPVKAEDTAGSPVEGTAEMDTKGDSSENGVGSAAMRPIFLGNLKPNYQPDDVKAIFQTPILPPGKEEGAFQPIAVDRLDQKRGYCFVFLKDATTAADKDNAERFVAAISGMEVENVSTALRAECARGDGRIKRKEDDRRKNIKPSDTLFVVNFQEETTKREDLKMLFEPFGELLRIDMKRNYAFVQFKTIDEATKAKDATNGGRLEQNVLTVEFVARERNRNSSNDGGGRRGRHNRRDNDRGRYRDDRHRDDRRGGYRGGDRGGMDHRGSDRDHHDRYNDDRGRRDDFRRDRSPYRGGSPGRGGYRGRSRSRSRSPPRGGDSYRGRDDRGGYSRSPPRGRYDDRGRDDGYRRYDDTPRGRSPDNYRGNDRGRDDRGYRG